MSDDTDETTDDEAAESRTSIGKVDSRGFPGPGGQNFVMRIPSWTPNGNEVVTLFREEAPGVLRFVREGGWEAPDVSAGGYILATFAAKHSARKHYAGIPGTPVADSAAVVIKDENNTDEWSQT